MEKELQNRNKILEFIFAGKSIFTIKSNVSGKYFTYKIKQAKNNKIHFVSILNGSDNYSNYKFFGTVFNKNKYSHSKKTNITEDAKSVIVFKWFLKNIINNTINNRASVYHEGKCGRCGRKLTTPESVENGIGPECIKITNKTSIY